MRFALLVLLPLAGSAVPGQQPSLVGSWHITYPAGMRIENGVPTPLMASGVLTVTVAGDSLTAELATDPAPDIPARPPAHLAARATPGQATFISRTQARLNLNGTEQEATAISTWVLEARGDSLVGTVERRIEGFDMGAQGPRPVLGIRRKE